jgi:hypothetical protein
VVKLVDALDSKSSEGDLMRVRVPPPAIVLKEEIDFLLAALFQLTSMRRRK